MTLYMPFTKAEIETMLGVCICYLQHMHVCENVLANPSFHSTTSNSDFDAYLWSEKESASSKHRKVTFTKVSPSFIHEAVWLRHP